MRNQQGVALITVLVIVAIVAGIGATAMLDQQIVIRRAENMLHGNQAILHLLSLETWAKEVLIEDRESGNSVDDLSENWATNLIPVEADGGTVAGNIIDLQGRFNLNGLVNVNGEKSESSEWQFRCLLEQNVGDLVDVNRLVAATIDWMDGNQETTYGAEDLDYLGRDPAYRTASRPFVSPSELLLIEGMSYEAWEKLAGLLTALPKRDAAINVNTAAVTVLQCMNELMNADIAADIVSTRESNSPYANWEEFVESLRDHLGSEAVIEKSSWNGGVNSEYFQVNTYAQFGNLEFRMFHILERGSKATDPVRVVMRSFDDNW